MPNPFDPVNTAKSVHDTLEAAYAGIPAGKSHAVLVDASTTGGIRALYVQHLADGWNVALESDWKGHGAKVEGRVAVLRAW